MSLRLQRMIVLFICGAGCCILIGWLLFGTVIFHRTSPLFQFVAYGIVGSLTFVLASSIPFSQHGVVHLVIFALLYWISGSPYFLAHLFFYASVVISVISFTQLVFQQWKSFWYLRPVILAAFMGFMFTVSTFLLGMIYSHSPIISAVSKNMLAGLLIGLGLGIGFEIGHLLSFTRQTAQL